MAKLTRFAVRRRTGEVWIATDELLKRKDMEEVFAVDAPSALNENTMPEPGEISLSAIHGMSKDQLVQFAKVKLGLELDPEQPKDALRDQVKEAIFMRPTADLVEEVVVDTTKDAKAPAPKGTGPARAQTRPVSPGQARQKAGV